MIRSFRSGWIHLLILAILSLLFVATAAFSLNWRMQHDTPVLLYMARLIDQHGFVPYRDLFEVQMPGTFGVFIALGRLIGYTDDFRYRLVDLCTLTALLAVTALWMRPFGWRVMWASAVLFGYVYLNSGFAVIMQREYLLLLPAIAGLTLVASARKLNYMVRALLLGFAFGLTAIVKPHFSIGLPIGFIFLWLDTKPSVEHRRFAWRHLLVLVTGAAIGFGIPGVITVIYLLQTNSLERFIEMVRDFGPIYATFSFSRVLKSYILVAPEERPAFIVGKYVEFASDYAAWFVSMAVVLYISIRSNIFDLARRRHMMLLLLLSVAYLIYPAFTGQFWPYHWLPAQYFLILLISIGFTDLPISSSLSGRLMQVGIICATIVPLIIPYNVLWEDVKALQGFYQFHTSPSDPALERADEIAAFLRGHLQAGDTVQSLDGIDGGMIHGMLMSDATLATSFPLDTQFYMNVSSPYIQALREQFIGELDAAQPRYIIEYGQRPLAKGRDVTGDFFELQLITAIRYHFVAGREGYNIYERNTTWKSSSPHVVIVYPLAQTDIASWFARHTSLNVKAVPQNFSVEGIQRILANFGVTDQIISVVFFNRDQKDPDQQIENQGANLYFRVSEYWSKQARIIDYVSIPDGCRSTSVSATTFGDIITMMSSSSKLTRIGQDQVVCIRLKWKIDRPVTESYKVAAYIIAADGTTIAQYDSVPRGYLAPTYSWLPGQPVIDQFAIHLPDDIPTGSYQVVVALYGEADLKRLAVTGNSPQVDSVIIGTFEIARP